MFLVPAFFFLPKKIATDQKTHAKFPHKPLGVIILIGILLVFLGDISLWSYTERIAAHIEIPVDTIGMILGATVIAGLTGGILAAVIDTRWGRCLPMTLGLLVLAMSIYFLPYARSTSTFILTMVAWNASYLFLLPYLMGTVSELDKDGSWAVMAASVQNIGAAVGPAIAGLVVLRWSYPGIGWFCGTGAMVALVLTLWVLRAMRRIPVGDALSEETASTF
ncbi:MAG: MFS transporter [Deltaproteobacteria bacterium]|nr:MFS transporter [Deltaproteobacteria bacterium]